MARGRWFRPATGCAAHSQVNRQLVQLCEIILTAQQGTDVPEVMTSRPM
jgi:hypothetical protein